MLPETDWRGVVRNVILCTGLLFDLTFFANADEMAKPGCVLCGRITDSTTGRSVTDAIVVMYGGPVLKTEADVNGFYCFEKIGEDRDYRIAIDSNEYVGIYDYDKMPAVNLQKDNHVVKDFKLDRACMFKVQVVDDANQPVENAEISVSYPDDYRSRRIGSDMLRRKTDKEGFCLIGGILLKTSILITATHGMNITTLRKDGYGVVHTQWDYAPGHLMVTLNDTEVTESGRIVLQKGVNVNGVAKYQDGMPAGDLKIEAYPDWWGIYTCPESYPVDANGCFTLRHIVQGMYRIQANIPKGEHSSMGINVLQTKLPLSNNELLIVTIPQKSPQALASICGRFIFTDGAVPNYVDIQAYSPASRYNSTMWNKYGRDANDTNFVIDRLEPGKYKLTFSSQEIEQKIIEDVNAPCENLLVELLPRNKTYLKGTVLSSENNQPIRNFKARARRMKVLRGATYQQPDKWVEVCDANGQFNIEATGPGIYQVQIAADGFACTWSEDVNTDQNVPAVIKLSAGGSIKGKVVNDDGKPVKGAKVLPLSMARGVRTMASCGQDLFISEEGAVETGDDGVFELKHLVPGRESIKVVHPDYAYSVVNDIEVKEGQTTEGINVVMPAGGIAEGYVYDAQGQPQPDVTLFFQDVYSGSDEKSGRFATVTSNDKGFYRVGGLPEQPLVVKRQKAWESTGVVCRTFVPANGRVSHIDLGGKPVVSGRIIINGVPLTNRRIVLASTELPSSDVFRCYVMAGPDGKFEFGGVPNGKWKIYCEDSEKQGEWIKITAIEVTGNDIDLGDVAITLSTLRTSIEYESGTPKWDVIEVQLQEGANPWDRPTTKLVQQTGEVNQYIIKNITPGEYYIALIRRDYVVLQRQVKITENDVNAIIKMPNCSSGIYGRLSGRYKTAMVIWTKDKSTIAYLKPDPNDDYKLDNIPAGHYYAGGNMLIDSEAFLEFDLADGEQKVLDVNVPDTSTKQTGSLHVIVLDENGSVISGADAYLMGGRRGVEPMINSGGRVYFVTEQGAYTLHVNFPGYRRAAKQVLIERFDIKNVQALRKPVLVRLERE